jgi:SAM-dependent methyltransferase
MLMMGMSELQNVEIEDRPGDKCLISPKLVNLAYRILLDRPPESREVVFEKASRLSTTGELRREFINSEEYRMKNPGGGAPTLSGNEPAVFIEDVQSQQDLGALFSHIQETWQHLGELEPYWSVLTAEQFKKSKLRDIDDFYNTGRQYVSTIFDTLDRNEIDYRWYQSCLEYGCGLGRVTRWLSEEFSCVFGYDISRTHLQEANLYLSNQDVKNVILRHITRPNDIINLPKVDLVYSIIVLQHNPPPLIQMIIKEMIRALNPGGAAMFQVPTYRLGYRFALREYLNEEATKKQMEMHILPQRMIFEIIGQEGGELLEVIEDGLAGGLRTKEVSNTFLVRKRCG